MELTPQLLIAAYCEGIFPMAHDDGEIYWYEPNPRAIIPLDDLFGPDLGMDLNSDTKPGNAAKKEKRGLFRRKRKQS